MSGFKASHPTPTTVKASLSFLQISFNDLRCSMSKPEKGSNSNNPTFTRQALFGIHIGITVLLTTLGIDRTPFLKIGLRTDIHGWTENRLGDEVDALDEIEKTRRLLQMLKNFVDGWNVGDRADRVEREGDVGPVENVLNSKTEKRNDRAHVTHQHVMNCSEITAPGASDIDNGETRQHNTSVGDKHTTVEIDITDSGKDNVSKGTPTAAGNEQINDTRVQTEIGTVGSNEEYSQDDNINEVPVIQSENHAGVLNETELAVDEDPVEDMTGVTKAAPVMIDLESHEVALNPAFENLEIADDPLPPIVGMESINQQQQSVRSGMYDVDENPGALEIEVNPDGTLATGIFDVIQDRVEPVEIVDDILREIGELLDDNNSLRDEDENMLLANEYLIPEHEEDSQTNEDGTDKDSERTVSCCIAGSLIDRKEGVRGPAFTDVREEDKIWVSEEGRVRFRCFGRSGTMKGLKKASE